MKTRSPAPPIPYATARDGPRLSRIAVMAFAAAVCALTYAYVPYATTGATYPYDALGVRPFDYLRVRLVLATLSMGVMIWGYVRIRGRSDQLWGRMFLWGALLTNVTTFAWIAHRWISYSIYFTPG